MKYVLWLWETLISTGVSPEQNIDVAENIKNTNRICIINGVLTIQGGFFVHYLMPEQQFYWAIIFSGICYFLGLVCNYFHQILFAKLLPWVIAIISVFYVSSVLGAESDVHTLYVIIIIGAMMSHSESNPNIIFALVILPLILTLILVLTNFALFAPAIPIPIPIAKKISVNVFFINVLSSIIATYFYLHRTNIFKKHIKQSKDELNDKYLELQKVNKEMDRFVYSVSHDLRAPIVSSLGLIGIALKEEEIEKVKYYLQLQEKSLWKLEQFISDILVYSRNTRMEIQPEQIDITALIEEVLSSQNLDLANSPVKVTTQLEIQSPIFSDKQRLTAILANLISNSVRYRNKKSDACFAHITVSSTQSQINIHIEDNGIGIAADHLPKIFDMFYRAHSNSEGSGLGLYIVKEVIQKLGGEIKIDSELGKGTAFDILIPNLTISTNYK